MPIVQLIALWQSRGNLDLVRVAYIRLGFLLNRIKRASRYLCALFNLPSQLWQIVRLISLRFALSLVTLEGSNQVGVALAVIDAHSLRQEFHFQWIPKKSDSKSNKIRQADFLELNFIISALRARHLLLIYLRATAISISVKLSKLI